MNIKKLLIVNDEEEAFSFLPKTLKEYGFQATCVDNAEEALRMARDNFFDIILSDVNMPGMNGVELFRKMKKISPLSSVILMSAASRHALTQKAFDEEASPAIKKPFMFERMLASIDAAADRTRIIIALDNSGLAGNILKQIEERNINILTACTSGETLDAAGRFHPDIIFIDDKLPGMDAFELCKTIRAKLSYIDVVMLLEKATPGAKELSIANGAINWIEKPLTSDKITAAAEIIKAKQNSRVTPFKILLVEDDTALAETITGILNDNGYAVDCFSNGPQALISCRENRYDALLSDYRLPEMSGIEIIKNVKALQPGIATILMTAYESMDVAVSAICEEVNDFILKPFDPSNLLRSLRKALITKNPK